MLREEPWNKAYGSSEQASRRRFALPWTVTRRDDGKKTSRTWSVNPCLHAHALHKGRFLQSLRSFGGVSSRVLAELVLKTWRRCRDNTVAASNLLGRGPPVSCIHVDLRAGKTGNSNNDTAAMVTKK